MSITDFVVQTAESLEAAGSDGPRRRMLLNEFYKRCRDVEYGDCDVAVGLRQKGDLEFLEYLWMSLAVMRPSSLYRDVFVEVIETRSPLFAVEWVVQCTAEYPDECYLEPLMQFVKLDTDEYALQYAKRAALEALVVMASDGYQEADEFVDEVVANDLFGLAEFTRELLGD